MHQGFYYLASPYHGTDEQQAVRTELSFIAASECLRQGVYIFTPLIYVNNVADRLNLTIEQRKERVMPYLLEFLRRAEGLLLLTAEGWKTSWGIKQELLFCLKHHIPVFQITPEQLYEPVAPRLKTPLSQQELEDLVG
jgi:hypothetical protein